MMKNSENHGKLPGKIEGFLAWSKNIFRLPSRFKSNLYTDITDVRQDTSETEQVSEKKVKQKTRQQIAVACTSKVRKRILKNLCAASKSRISPARAEIARKILAEINKGNDLTQKSNATKDKQVEPVLEVSEKPSRAKEFIPGMLGKIQAGYASVRQRFCFGIGTGNVGQPVAS